MVEVVFVAVNLNSNAPLAILAKIAPDVVPPDVVVVNVPAACPVSTKLLATGSVICNTAAPVAVAAIVT